MNNVMTKIERIHLCLAALKKKKGEFRLAVDLDAPIALLIRLMGELQALKLCLESEVEREEENNEANDEMETINDESEEYAS